MATHPEPDLLYFTGSGDPRNNCVAIGFHHTKPVAFKFATVSAVGSTRTTLILNNQTEISYIDWTVGNHLGGVVRDMSKKDSREFATHLVMRSTENPENGKMFDSCGRRLEWRKIGQGPPYGYELYAGPERLARYELGQTTLPSRSGMASGVTAYARMDFEFMEFALLRDALIALCLNIWIDLHGM